MFFFFFFEILESFVLNNSIYIFIFIFPQNQILCDLHFADVALMESSDFMQQLRSFKPQSLGCAVARRKSSTTLIFPLPPQACSGKWKEAIVVTTSDIHTYTNKYMNKHTYKIKTQTLNIHLALCNHYSVYFGQKFLFTPGNDLHLTVFMCPKIVYKRWRQKTTKHTYSFENTFTKKQNKKPTSICNIFMHIK